MSAYKIEEWTFGLSFVFAAAFALALHGQEAPSLTTQANAAVNSAPAYIMTVTAKRLPAECKGLSMASSASCASFADANTKVELRAR
ncbi:MAG: hypothetical protein K8S25_14040 [Alphaproteobacteria bacterium]|nr:hypothetical protein [Alphaproteobacteria bacterium]